MFEKVTRKKSKLRCGLTGVSGSGKTVSALLLAYGIAGDWSKVALIDTEHERARFYADRSDLGIGAFMYASLTAPFSPDRYIGLIQEAAKVVGEDGVIIIDSLSHGWDSDGGILEIKDKIEATTRKNSFTAWSDAGRIQNNFINIILGINAHTICTMRAKTAYVMEENERGKQCPVKVGLAPVQRENVEYEFDIMLNIDRNTHKAFVSKDTTFLDGFCDVITPDLGRQLKDWLDNGVEPSRCADCKQVIRPAQGRTAEQIVQGTQKAYGRSLCWNCMAKEIKGKKKEGAENDGL